MHFIVANIVTRTLCDIYMYCMPEGILKFFSPFYCSVPELGTKFLCRTEKVEHFGKFVTQMDETYNRMFQKFDDHCNKMSGRE